MKMKFINKYLLISLLCMLFASCSKDFLNIEPKGVSTDIVFYSTIEGIEQGITGTYASLNACPASLHNLDMMYLAWGNFPSDDAEAGGEPGGGDITDFQMADRGTTIPGGGNKAVSENFWGYNYKSILRANSAINGIKTFRANNPNADEATKAKLTQYEGEMNFVVAFVHFKMVQVYGGVPIVDHILASSEYGVKRNSIAECLHFVQEKLAIASAQLPVKSKNGAANIGRISKGAAQALLAKAYLYEASYAKNYSGDDRFTGCTNTYDKALVYADSVINSNEYKLVGLNGETFDTYWNQNGSPIYPDKTPGYRYIFTVDAENGDESLFEVQSENDGLAYMISRGSYINVYTATRNVLNTAGASSSFGWGFNCPTDEMYNAYEEGDLRREVTCGKDGAPIYPSAVIGWGKMSNIASPTNMMCRKFEASPAQYWSTRGTDGNGPTNLMYIRYGDVILIGAEAAIETGNSSKALTYVNMIRKRARNGAATGVPADLASVSLTDVQKERRLELGMEGQRFFDLVRWKMQDILPDQPLMRYANGAPTTPIYCTFTPGKNDFMPIPQIEVVNSNFNLVQYSGW
jgi:starch-binding outer membrane protein, SusD/RagB family